MACIEVNNLTKKFKTITAVDELSFSVEEGEILGFLGSNGAGKTTTINILTGLLLPTSGEARLFGLDVVHDIQAVREKISLVPQTISLYEELSVYENLEFFGGLYFDDDVMLRKRISEMCEVFKLTKLKDRRVSEISGGYQRRTSFAAALIPKPKVLFLDEPLAGIDIQTHQLIIDYLRSLDNLTTILATHSLKDAEEICDKVMILDHGKKIFYGSPKNIATESGAGVEEKMIVIFYNMKKLDEGKTALFSSLGKARFSGNTMEIKLQDKDKIFDFMKILETVKDNILNIEMRKPKLKDVYEGIMENKNKN